MAKIICIYKAKGGGFALFLEAVMRWLGLYSCDLSRITHNALGQKKQWRDMKARLSQELGHTHWCVYPSRAEPAYVAASSGREPCVLWEDEQGNLSMMMDWNDVALAGGSVARYEQILRSKLLMY
jgi:hypothetical protein